MRTHLTSLSLLLVLALLPACAGRQKNERIPKGPEAEAILELLERYRHSMEARDVGAILSLTSPDYADSRGTLTLDDDLGREELKKKLEAEVEKVSILKLNLEVLKIELGEEKVLARIELRYDIRFQLELPGGSTWHNEVNVNQMSVRLEEKGWRVIDGL